MEIIHIVLGKANPQRMNGVNKVVNELASQQAAAGIPVSVWGISHSLEHDYPARLYNTRLFKAYKNRFRLDKNLLSALSGLPASAIIHIHGGFIPTFYQLSRVLKKRGIPFILTPHGSYNTIAMNRSKWTKKLYFRMFEKVLLSNASGIHCLGKSEVEGLQQIYPNHKTFLIPYGFEFNHSFQSLPPGNQFVIVFCGRIDIYTKGIDLIIDAFHEMACRYTDTVLWIIGDSNERDKLEKMIAEKDLQNRVVLYGSKYGEEKNKLISQAHVFIHPSRNEGLPTAVLEAASMGVPCVVTEATNVGDSIRAFHCGEVISNPVAQELFLAVDKIYHQIKEKGMQELKENSLRMVRSDYNWKLILEKFNELYKRFEPTATI